jgi:LDH2 family malate/lactate/ureidoglycolate dehydrogenase
MERVSERDLLDLVASIYCGCGVPDESAQTVAAAQVDANLVGHDSHGVTMTPRYVKQIENGELNPLGKIEVVQSGVSAATIDGNWNFGFVVTEQAVSQAVDLATTNGVGTVSVRRQGHIGRLGRYLELATAQGCMAMITADSGRAPKAVAPYGGRERRLGTNPIAFGVPSTLDGPIILDMATSNAALGKVNLAKSRGEEIPDDWVVDANGDATRDPNAYAAGGALLPLGGGQGHKGYGLAFIVEILSGVLPGIGFGVYPDGRHNDGVFLTVFDPARFYPHDDFAAEVTELANYVKSSEPAKGFREVLYPGEIEHRTRRERRELGIPIEASRLEELTALRDEVSTRT